MDSLLVSPPKIHIFEVKNFEGDFLIEDNRMRLISGKEIKNPLIHLSRTESLFRQLL
ncbi:nuclease-related domain-containing protein [Ferdinandcohnia sp. SAFN-114]|uniref:nuclease-related domain-containing protein n=1 Tax=Ferdinandcohnia sp. SAFN-114 TaxID=3387275 RepID=UPI003F7F02EA